MLILLVVDTSTRPGTLVEADRYPDSNDYLKYKDTELYLVRDPASTRTHIIIMKMRLRFFKGKRNAGVA